MTFSNRSFDNASSYFKLPASPFQEYVRLISRLHGGKQGSCIGSIFRTPIKTLFPSHACLLPIYGSLPDTSLPDI